MKIGILGGSFNPVHLGHLILAEQIRETTGLGRVLFIPASSPPHKPGTELAAGEHRLAMVRLAIEGNPFFEASDVEVRRGGVSYTIDTILELRREHPGDDFHFIIGADSVPELPTWYRTCELVDLCTFLIGSRPGHDIAWDLLTRALPAATVERLRKNVIPTIPVGISSSAIRLRIREGRSIRYLVPRQVEEYIGRNDLYRMMNDER